MNYELKMTKSRKVGNVFLSLIPMALGGIILYLSIRDGESIKTVLLMIILICAVIDIFRNTIKCLTFNNVNFYLKGRTYTYQQIEKIGVYGGKFGSVAYEVYVDGKRIYSFDMDYEGAKEFMYYLDFYKVPGTPRV